MTTIELTYDNAKEILELKDTPLSQLALHLSHLPFNRFNIQFPYGAFNSYEDVYREAVRSAEQLAGGASKKFNPLADKLAKEICKSNMDFFIENKDACINFTATNKMLGTLIKFRYLKGIGIPVVESSSYGADAQLVAIKIIRFVASVVEFFNNPVIIKTKSVEKEIKHLPSKTYYARNKKTYIYKTVYRYENLQVHHRTYERTMESWSVKGHWRTYATGKKVWINAYHKGIDRECCNDKTYRITQSVC